MYVVHEQFTLYMRGREEDRRTMLTSELPLQLHAHHVIPRKVHIVITEMVMMLQIIVLVEMAITAITIDMILVTLRTTEMILAWHAQMETC